MQLEIISNKIISEEQLDRKLSFWRFQSKKIVFTNGCFDILHYGHIDYLAKASDLGDILIIGLNTDASIKRLKGKQRPINIQHYRAMQLAALKFVDVVIPFDQDTPYDLIKRIQPDVLVKGNDYKKEEIVGFDIVTAKNGRVETIEFVKGLSSTNIIKSLSEDIDL